MRRLAQLWRTTTVRLTALFIAIFVLFSVALLGYIAFQTSYSIQRVQTRAIEREINQLRTLEQQRGIRALALAVQQLARRPGPGIYYLGDQSGLPIVGNVSDIPAEIVMSEGMHTFSYARNSDFTNREFDDDQDPDGGFALVRSEVLLSGFRLVVGRDITERRGFTAIIIGTLGFGLLGIVGLSALAGGVTATRVLRRIDSITNTSQKIMSGNLSERVPVTNRNDEFDELANSLNRMLARIEQLLQGLKEVTDNVAHDLKTPLTRLRNRAEAALRDGSTDQDHRSALERTISESDDLIKTFNALLLIARIEAGTPSGSFSTVNIAEILADVTELYEPVAEEQNVGLSCDMTEKLSISANKELLVQALVNLIENALKYGAVKDESERGEGEPRASRIKLNAAQRNGTISISVCDNGPGIPEEQRGHVVERFVRLEKSRADEGSGLGLSLVAAVARLHGGTFELTDNDPGLCATIHIPLTRPS